jgi:isoleucyl-tRNA synthetase
LPVWKTEDSEEQICIGSIAELIAEIENGFANGIVISVDKKLLFEQRKNCHVGIQSLKTALLNPSEIANGIYRNDIGNIGLYFGKTGDENNKFKGGYGLSHIIAKRFNEGVDGYEIALKLVETIVLGKVEKQVEAKKTIHIIHNNVEAVLSKDKFGEEEIWLLTGWQINKPDVDGEICTTTTSTHFIPTFRRDEVGAGLSDAKIRKNISNELLFDLHKPFVDDIFFISPKGKIMTRVPDLIDVWFDSGAMPYAQQHFPFENKALFSQNYPADFIAEGVDQTRGWFYTLHAIASLIKESVEEELEKAGLPIDKVDGRAYKTVVSNGLVLDKNGVKMSKRLGNIVNPFDTIEKYGADATRWYLVTNASPWDNLKFDLNGIQEVQRKFFGTLYNTYQFFVLYANVDGFAFKENYIPLAERPEIDRWILSSLNTLIKKVTDAMEDYEPTQAGRLMEQFVDEHLSNWYVRLCRRRFWKGDYEADKIAAYQTLYECLETLTKLMAPISPFFSDAIFKNLNAVTERFNVESIHHVLFPKYDTTIIDVALEERMQLAQDVCSLVLSLRKKVNIKVRQPLQKLLIPVLNPEMKHQLEKIEDLIKAEVNVKELEYITETEGIIKKKIKANFKTLGAKLGANMKEAAGAIAKLSQHQIAELEQIGKLHLQLSTINFQLATEDVEILAEDIPGWSVASKGSLTVALDIIISEALQNEGNARELVNRIQNIRKESGFELTDRIFVEILDNTALSSSIKQFNDYICREILAENITWLSTMQQGIEIDVNEQMLKIRITKKG